MEDCFPLSGQQNTTAPSTRISSNVLKMNFMKRTSLKQLASANTGLTSVYLYNKTAEKQKQKQQQQQQQSQKSQKLTNPTNSSDSPPIEEYGRYSVLANEPLNNNNKDSVNGIKQEPSDETYPEVCTFSSMLYALKRDTNYIYINLRSLYQIVAIIGYNLTKVGT